MKVGQRFGRLVVVERGPNTSAGATTWLCKCDCDVQAVVRANNLRSGHTVSCGCLSRENGRMLGLASRVYLTTLDAMNARLASNRKWAKANPDNIRRNNLRSNKHGTDNLLDWYVRSLIRDATNIPSAVIPKEMIDAKRELLRINRLLEELR